MGNAFEYSGYYTQGKALDGINNTFALVLGNFREDMLSEMSIGDYVQYEQNVDVTADNFILLYIKGKLPSGWRFKVLLGANVERTIDSTKVSFDTNVFTAMFINVAGLTGTHALKFRLERYA